MMVFNLPLTKWRLLPQQKCHFHYPSLIVIQWHDRNFNYYQGSTLGFLFNSKFLTTHSNVGCIASNVFQNTSFKDDDCCCTNDTEWIRKFQPFQILWGLSRLPYYLLSLFLYFDLSIHPIIQLKGYSIRYIPSSACMASISYMRMSLGAN